MPRTPHIKCLLVDDNPFITTVLADLLREEHPGVQVVATAANGSEALHHIQALQPDLVFLDVEMPDMTGFEVLARLDHLTFQTIFVTAHSHYAIQAIRFNALDYLVKPIKRAELAQALKRYRSKTHAQLNQHQVQLALENMGKASVQDQVLFLPTQDGGLKMTLREIVMVEGDRNYSTLHLTGQRSRLSAKTLGYFEDILQEKDFFRCHRSFVVNRQHITRQQGDHFILRDERQVPISRRRKMAAKAWWHQH